MSPVDFFFIIFISLSTIDRSAVDKRKKGGDIGPTLVIVCLLKLMYMFITTIFQRMFSHIVLRTKYIRSYQIVIVKHFLFVGSRTHKKKLTYILI